MSESTPSEELTLEEAVSQLREHLTYAKVGGIPHAWFERPAIGSEAVVAATPAPEATDAAAASSASESAAVESCGTELPNSAADPTKTARAAEIAGMDWPELEATALACTACRLCETRTNVVFGVGNRQKPRIVFVGEGPGADEDRVGEPFVGKAGQLLTAAITKGLGLRREDVYIANVVKCRPPENRTPLPDEAESCSPFLFRQLELLQPEVIVALGGPAQQALTGAQTAGGRPVGITKLRGTWLAWRGVKVMPTFHPAYILRNPAAKREFWDDLQAVMKELGLGKT